MNRQPLITGVGLLSALGLSAGQTWDALLAGRHILDHSRVPIEFPPELPRVSQLAIRAAREALADSAVPVSKVDAIVFGTSKGPVERWLALPAALDQVQPRTDFGLCEPADDVAHDLGITGPRLTLSAACASGLHALIRGAMLVDGGHARRVLVVAAEASVHPLFVGSFQRLGVLSAPSSGCRPFDRDRGGFVMSEAAAAVVLQRHDDAASTGNSVRIDRYRMGADASHLTGADPEARALRHVLSAALDGRPVDLLHAHGTATPANDPLELAALDDAAAGWPSAPAVYSHKAALGHSQGAAGLVSVVLNVLCHRRRIVPPNVRTAHPLPARNVRIDHQSVRRPVARSVALASGFGGALAAVTLESA